MSVSASTRGIFATVFLALSVGGLYKFRIEPTLLGYPVHMETVLKNKQLSIPFQYVKIPDRFLPWGPADEFLRMLVTAFSWGVLRLDEDAFWQQIHFLVQFLSPIAVMTVEAYRPRNSGAFITYTSVLALLYQTIGGAVIYPLYAFFYVYTSSDTKYLRVGRPVHLYVAKALIPAVLIGYLLPTIAPYLQYKSYKTNLYFIAFWQFAPIYVNVLMGNFSGLINAVTSNKNITTTSDAFYLRATYLVSILSSFAVHAITIAGILNGNPKEVSLASVFIPSFSRLGKSTSQDIHYMFQMDWVFTGTTALLLGVYAVIQISAQQASLGIQRDSGRILALMVVLVVLTGPGGALAAVWWWRENSLIEIEARVAAKALAKAK